MENLEVGTVCGMVTLTHQEPVIKDGRKRGNWWVGRCECGAFVGPYTAAHWKKKIRSCAKCKYGNRKSLRIGGMNNAASSVYRNYKASANKRGITFELNKGEFMEQITGPCFYCERTNTSYFNPTQDWEERFEYTGLDRVDSSIGYRLDNIVACCKVCNMAKSSMPIEEFFEWCKALSRNLDRIQALVEWETAS